MKLCRQCGGIAPAEMSQAEPGAVIMGKPCRCPRLYTEPSQLDRIETMLQSLEAGEFRAEINRIEQKLDRLLAIEHNKVMERAG